MTATQDAFERVHSEPEPTQVDLQDAFERVHTERDDLQDAFDPAHAEALNAFDQLNDKIRYAAGHLTDPRTASVREWLAVYGIEATRSYTSSVLSGWRRVRGLPDTGEHRVLTPELLAELDADFQPEPTPTNVVQPEPTPTNVVQPEPTPTNVVQPEPTPTNVVQPEPTPTNVVQPEPTAVKRRVKARGTGMFYLVALLTSMFSLDTSARFFALRLGISGWVSGTLPILETPFRVPLERLVLCGIVEITLVACGYAMMHAVRRGGQPGPAQIVALAAVSVSAFMAVSVSPRLDAGLVRAILGPVLALVALHLALGIEVHVRSGGTRSGALASIFAEIRERFMSRLGLGNDARDAVTRTQDRAADRAAKLATSKALFRKPRLARAIRKANVALDARTRARMMAQVATLRHLDALIELDMPSPWTADRNHNHN